jgi:hypothetical protein
MLLAQRFGIHSHILISRLIGRWELPDSQLPRIPFHRTWHQNYNSGLVGVTLFTTNRILNAAKASIRSENPHPIAMCNLSWAVVNAEIMAPGKMETLTSTRNALKYVPECDLLASHLCCSHTTAATTHPTPKPAKAPQIPAKNIKAPPPRESPQSFTNATSTITSTANATPINAPSTTEATHLVNVQSIRLNSYWRLDLIYRFLELYHENAKRTTFPSPDKSAYRHLAFL